MRVFLDTEFTALRQDARLISLALVAENGSYFYAEFTDFDASALSDWHKEHILPSLIIGTARERFLPPFGKCCRGTQTQVRKILEDWLHSHNEQLIIWADVPAYDWVLFCQLFGGALYLPENIHYIVRDLATLLESKGHDPDLNRFDFAYRQQPPPFELPQHNALADAFAGLACLEKLAYLQTNSS